MKRKRKRIRISESGGGGGGKGSKKGQGQMKNERKRGRKKSIANELGGSRRLSVVWPEPQGLSQSSLSNKVTSTRLFSVASASHSPDWPRHFYNYDSFIGSSMRADACATVHFRCAFVNFVSFFGVTVCFIDFCLRYFWRFFFFMSFFYKFWGGVRRDADDRASVQKRL